MHNIKTVSDTIAMYRVAVSVALLLGPAALLCELCRAPCLDSCWLFRIPRSLRVNSGALEPPVRILAVVKRHAMDTQDVGLQVPLLRGTVGAVAALERPVTCRQKEK